MIFQNQVGSHSISFVAIKQWLDSDDEQEDELDDVSKGILDAPTDDEGPGSIDEPSRQQHQFKSEDEDLLRQEEAFRRNIGNLPS